MRRIVLAAALLLVAAMARADTVTVFAAASLREALEANARAFEARSGHKVVVAHAASSALARQVEAGAPAELFLSADVEWVAYLEAKGLLAAGSRRDLLGNELVLVAPAASKVQLRLEPGADVAAALGGKRIALANPDAVPAGKYARAAFRALGAWGAIEARVAAADNVRAALALVARGEVPLGVVYRTDALAEKGVRIVDVFPASSHPAIVYPLVATRKARPAALAFATFLASREALATFAKHGFRLP
jgi:molybdate transport system substrate-binding protein